MAQDGNNNNDPDFWAGFDQKPDYYNHSAVYQGLGRKFPTNIVVTDNVDQLPGKLNACVSLL